MRKCLIWVLLVSVLVIGGIACAQAAPPAPTVTILPENPTSTSDIIVRYDKVYDEVRFKMIQNGEIISGGQDTLTDTDFDWGYMEAGEWQIDAQARVGDEWSEHFIMDFTIAEDPVLNPPKIVSCPDSVLYGQSFTLTYEVDNHSDPFSYDLCLLDNNEQTLGFVNTEDGEHMIFDDWPDELAPGQYTLRLQAWQSGAPGYKVSDAKTYKTITVKENNVRPEAPQSLTVQVNGKEVQSLARGDQYLVTITAPGADAVKWSVDYSGLYEDTDHSRAISIDADGKATVTLTVHQSMNYPEMTLKAYARRNNAWSEPLIKKYRISDVAVSGKIAYSFNAEELTDAEGTYINPDRDYEGYIGTLHRGGVLVKTVKRYPADSRGSLYLGELDQGDYVLSGRGYINDTWTEESSCSFTVKHVEFLDTPVILSAPEEVQLGEAFTVKITPDARARYSTLSFYYEGRYMGFENAGKDGIFDYFSGWSDECQPGNYECVIISYADGDEIRPSRIASVRMHVKNGKRPNPPAITLNPETPAQGTPFSFVFDKKYEAVNVEIYTGDGMRYTGVDGRNCKEVSMGLEVGDWIAMPSVCVDGIWSTRGEYPFSVTATESVIQDQYGKYEIEENGTLRFVESVNPKASEVIIPDAVTLASGKKAKVTAIDARAFDGNKKVKKVVVGSNVKTIGDYAFNGCTKLASVKLGTSVTTIGVGAFQKCTALTEITIPAKVTKIGANAFNGCKKLTKIIFKTKKLTAGTVGSNAFKNINSKASVKCPSKQLSTYKTFLLKKGMKKTVKFTK